MKTFLFLVGMLTCALLPSQAQQTADELAFANAIDLYEDGRTDDALLAFYEFMSVYPKSRLRGSAHFNIGYMQFQRHHLDAAVGALTQILQADYNELDANNLMEPYMLYKHQSCRILAEISMEQRDYKAAEEYIRLFEDVYPYQHFCGNELSAYAIYAATLKARVYEGQGKINKAIQALVPYTFSDALASNQELLELLINILSRNYTDDEIKQQLNQALSTIQLKKKNQGATIALFGKQVPMNDFVLADDAYDLAHYQHIANDNLLFRRFL